MMNRATLLGFSQLMRLEKPIGTLLLLWPTYWALWIAAQGFPRWDVLVVFTIGVFFMRSAGCVINDFADRKVDGHVERTKNRPLAAGTVSSKQALGLFFSLLIISFLLVLTMNSLTIGLSFIAVALAATYPFMKRYTHLPQMVLGMAFGWAIPMGFAAQSNELPTACWWLFAANIAWTVAYDTMYGMVDREDDLKIGVKSTAILFGRYDLVAVGLLQIITLLCLIKVTLLAAIHPIFYLAIAIVAVLFIIQQRHCLHRTREAYFASFIANNYVGLTLFLGLVIAYLLD